MSEAQGTDDRPAASAGAWTLAVQAQTASGAPQQGTNYPIIDKGGPRSVAEQGTSDAAAPPVNPPFRLLPEHLPGRDEQKQALVASLDAAQGRVLHVLHGIGGGGKSALALWLGQQAHDRGMPVYWIGIGRGVPPDEMMLAVAQARGVAADAIARARSTGQGAQQLVWDALEVGPRWLLVFDNVDDVTQADLLSHGGGLFDDATGWVRSSAAGLVVVTSRQGDRAVWGEAPILRRVEPLGDRAGTELLTRLAPDAGSDKDAARLAGRLGGLPLALRLAGSYLGERKGRRRTFAAYLEELDRDIALLDAGNPIPGRIDDEAAARRSVQLTWELSLRLLDEWGLGPARPLLAVLACLGAPHPLRIELVDAEHLAGTPVEPDDRAVTTVLLDQVVNALVSVALLDRIDVPHGNDAEPVDCVALHPLVASVVADSLARSTDAAWQAGIWTAAQAVLGAHTPEPESDGGGRRVWATLPPVHQALLRGMPAELGEPLQRAVVDGNRCALHLLSTGALGPAHAMTQLTLARAHDLHTGGTELLDARLISALVNQTSGALPLVQEELTALWTDAEHVLDPEHPMLMLIRQRLAAVMSARGQVDEAAELYFELIDEHDRGVAPELALATRFGFAQLMAQRGMTEDAERELTIVVDDERKRLGPEHPETLVTRAMLADLWATRGRLKEARAELEAVLGAQERHFGPDNPMTLAARVALFSVTTTLQDQGGAESQLGQLIKITRSLNPEDPLALLGLAALSEAKASSGAEGTDSRVNERRLREVCLAMTHSLGEDNPLVLGTRLGAAVQRLEHDAGGAEDEVEEIIERQTALHGPVHAATLKSRLVLAQIMVQRGDRLDLAEDVMLRLLDDQISSIGPIHPQTVSVLYALANIKNRNGDLVASKGFLRDALAGLEQLHDGSPDHEDIQETRGTLVRVLCGLGEFGAAEPELLTLIASVRRTEGDDAVDVLAARTMLAQLWAADGRPVLAEAELREVLAGLRTEANAENGLGGALLVQAMIAELVRLRGGEQALAEAAALLENSMAGLERGWGEDDEDALEVRLELGEVLHEQGSFVRAERCLQIALNRMHDEFGDDDPRTRRAVASLSIVAAELEAAPPPPGPPPPGLPPPALPPAPTPPALEPAASGAPAAAPAPAPAPAEQLAAAWRHLLEGEVAGARAAFAALAEHGDDGARVSAERGLAACGTTPGAAPADPPVPEPVVPPPPTDGPPAAPVPVVPDRAAQPTGRHSQRPTADDDVALSRPASAQLLAGRLAEAERDLRASLQAPDGVSTEQVRVDLVRLLLARGRLAAAQQLVPAAGAGRRWEMQFWLAELGRERALAPGHAHVLRALVRDGEADEGWSSQAVLEARRAYAAATADLGHPWAAYADLHALARACDRGRLERAALAARVAAAVVRPPGAADDRDGADAELDAAHRAAGTLAGPDDHLTLRARRGRAWLRLLRGDADRAVAELGEVLTARERLSAPPDREQAAVRHDLAVALHATGELGRATDLQQSVVTELTEGLGPGHPETLRARVALAAVSRDRRVGDAHRELHDLLVVQIARRGPGHPDVALTHHELGIALGARGETSAAGREYARAATIGARVWGEQHPRTAASRAALARL